VRIVFMGTPDFAVPSLNALLSLSQHTVSAVVTQPDRPQGRGLKTTASPVKRTGEAHGLPIFQPERLKSRSFRTVLEQIDAELFVVVAFRILPPELIALPRLGVINLHASLLPRYRGAAPIQWAIVNGERETGVTTFFIDRQVDTGRILLQRRTTIEPQETAGELHDRLALMGAETLVETISQVAAGTAHPIEQTGEVSLAPKLFRTDGWIDWTRPATEIHNRIRGFNPYPMAFTTWRGRTLRLFRSETTTQTSPVAPPGTLVIADANTGLIVQTGYGCLQVRTLQPEGRNVMSGEAFVRGYHPLEGELLGEEGSKKGNL